MSLVGEEAKVVQEVVNQGIDAHLQACFIPDRGDKYKHSGSRLECEVSGESLAVLLRRLTEKEYGPDSECESLAGDILRTIGFGFEVETCCFEVDTE
jgi:hypothetical protein